MTWDKQKLTRILNRNMIIWKLTNTPLRFKDLLIECDLSKPTLTLHLRQLQNDKVIIKCVHNNISCYRLVQ